MSETQGLGSWSIQSDGSPCRGHTINILFQSRPDTVIFDGQKGVCWSGDKLVCIKL